ncbi:MAG TPA: DUF3618 domain-containing protein [Xanthomonadaceae bacterium]|nr:DUF3618 domain-containing protein [Xanthomonadaceae bacterium]
MATTDRIRMESYRDPDQLQREIDAQRQHVTSLVAALENRLSPGELASTVLGAGKDGSKEFAANLSHAVRANPVPALLTAGGMLWLYAQRDRPIHRDPYEVSDEGPGMRDRVSGKWDSTKGKAKLKAHQARMGFDNMLEDNPVALGALGIAAGAMLGAILPSTESEDRWMGDMRDRVAEGFKSGAREATRPNGSANSTAH